MMKVNFVTTNSEKFAVAKHFFEGAGLQDRVNLTQYDMETPEIQADSVEEVALNSAKWVAEQLNEPVVVADAGLAINALQGFPGPYIKYMNATLEAEDVMAMMELHEDKSARFVDALAYYDPNTKEECVFVSVTLGMIAAKLTPVEGSVVDRLFIADGFDRPLAELSEAERMTVWNTNRWQQLADFLLKKP